MVTVALRDRIAEDMKSALKSGDELRTSVLRMLSAAVHNREIEKRTKLAKAGKPFDAAQGGAPEPLSDDEALEVVAGEAKKRREAIEGFEKGGRLELAEKEKGELSVLEAYLPQQLSEEAILQEIGRAIQEVGARGQKDAGKVMAHLSPRLKGRADMGKVSRIVSERLAAGS